MTNLSLRSRAAFAAAFTLLVFFSLAGFGLLRAYEDSLNNAAEGELRAYMLSLLGAIDVDSQGKVQVEDLSISVFDQPNSGVFAEIWHDQDLQWRSNSLIGQPLPSVESKLGEYLFFSDITGDQLGVGSHNNLLSLKIDWNDGEIAEQFQIVVANDSQPFLRRQQDYKKNLLVWLFGLGLGLVFLQILLFKWLFRPIDKVIHELESIQSGERQCFSGKYPNEVNLLVQSLNQFVDNESRQIKSVKDSLANLAHSLKTPLAVMRAELSKQNNEGDPHTQMAVDQHAMQEQIERISTVVNYQLNRTSSSVRPSYRQAVECKTMIMRLVTVLQKLHKDKGVSISNQMPESLVFRGDVDDLAEVVGNILENACKWAESKITVDALNDADKNLCLTVIDDGPGIPEDQLVQVLQRGRRLDSKTEGQGIGLSMVSDIVDSYSGSIEFKSAKEVNSNFNSGLAVLIKI